MDKLSFEDLKQGRGNIDIATAAYAKDLPLTEAELLLLDEFPLFDVAEAIKLNLSENNLRTLLKDMIDKSFVTLDVDKMKEAHDAGDWDEVQRLAHEIKGGAIYIGAIKMKMACQYLERYWKIGQRKLLEQLYQQALQAIEDSLKVISAWLAREK